MKVGVLTFHDTLNFGAALQTYATQKAIEGCGFSCEVVNYTNEYRARTYWPFGRFVRQASRGDLFGAVKSLVGAPLIYQRRRSFGGFYDKRVAIGPVAYRSPESIRKAPPEYDTYLAGSDQIWSWRNNGGDATYLLDFVADTNRTASYASSFGMQRVPDGLSELYSSCLRRIRALSVREKTGSELVFALTGRSTPVVLDPVFLLSREDWLAFAGADSRRQVETGAVFSYVSHSMPVEGVESAALQELGARPTLSFSTHIRMRDILSSSTRLMISSGPEEFVNALCGSSFVVTTSYHATVFAIVLHRPFLVFLSGDGGRDSRVTDLLSDLGLNDRIYSPTMTTRDLEKGIDWDRVSERLYGLRDKSLRFLASALER